MVVMSFLRRRTLFAATPISLAVSWTVGKGVVISALAGILSTYLEDSITSIVDIMREK